MTYKNGAKKESLQNTEQSKVYFKDFDKWNLEKKIFDGITEELIEFPHKKEVWMVKLGLNVGYEQNGESHNFSRPVLVIKKFNNQMFWAVPLSSKQKKFDFYYNFIDPNGLGVAAILAQMKLISVKRFTRKMYELDSEVFNKIRNSIRELI